jgi:predicted DCC family thiol-disulfide oxidoreductase YuxK
MQRLDRAGRIDFVDLTRTNTACPLDRTLMLSRFHATTQQGETLSGAAAFAAMWREIPILRPIGLAARNKHVLALLEGAYLLFLRIRPLLQRLAR